MSDRCYECGSDESVCIPCTYEPTRERAEAAEARVEQLRAALTRCADYLETWGRGDLHYGDLHVPQDPNVVKEVAAARRALADPS